MTTSYIPEHSYKVTLMYRGGAHTEEPYIYMATDYENATYRNDEPVFTGQNGGFIEFRVMTR